MLLSLLHIICSPASCCVVTYYVHHLTVPTVCSHPSSAQVNVDEKVQFLTDHHHDLLNQRAALDSRLKEAKALGREVAATHIAAEVRAHNVLFCALLNSCLLILHRTDQREYCSRAGQQHQGERPAAGELLHQPREEAQVRCVFRHLHAVVSHSLCLLYGHVLTALLC